MSTREKLLYLVVGLFGMAVVFALTPRIEATVFEVLEWFKEGRTNAPHLSPQGYLPTSAILHRLWSWSESPDFVAVTFTASGVAVFVAIFAIAAVCIFFLSASSTNPGIACLLTIFAMWLALFLPSLFGPIAVYADRRLIGFDFNLLPGVILMQVMALAVPWILYWGWRDSQSSQNSEFSKLTFRPLPPLLFRGRSLTISYEGGNPFPLEGFGPAYLDVLDGLIYLMVEKRVVGLNFWRCSSESDKRVLLLIDQRLGLLRHVWLLLDLQRPGGGNDLALTIHRVVPRHADWLDYSLVRPLLFPWKFLWSAVEGAFHILEFKRPRAGAWSAFIMKYTGFAMAIVGVIIFFSFRYELLPLLLGICFIGLTFAFVIYMVEANPQDVNARRANDQLAQIVHGALMETITRLRRLG